MNVRLRQLDRILIVEIDGPVAEPDLVKLTGYINTLASKLAAILFDVHAAEIGSGIAATLTRLKAQYERSRIRFLIVTPDLMGADFARLADAVASIKGVESERILELFAKESELERIEQAIRQARSALVAAVGLTETPESPLAEDELARAFRALEDRSLQLMRQFRTLSSEINTLRNEGVVLEPPGADNPTAVTVGETKRRVLDVVRSKLELD